LSSQHAGPYIVPKREVKEEYATPSQNWRRGSGGGITFREPARKQKIRAGSGGRSLLVPKPEVKEEEAAKAMKVAEYLRR
jgi:hypothetical protein